MAAQELVDQRVEVHLLAGPAFFRAGEAEEAADEVGEAVEVGERVVQEAGALLGGISSSSRSSSMVPRRLLTGVLNSCETLPANSLM